MKLSRFWADWAQKMESRQFIFKIQQTAETVTKSELKPENW